VKVDIIAVIACCSSALLMIKRWASGCSALHLSPASVHSRLSRTTL